MSEAKQRERRAAQVPPAPTAEYVGRLITEGRARYGRYHQACDEIEAMRHREYDVHIPDAYKAVTRQVKVPIIADLFRRVISLLTEGRPVAEQIPIEEGPKAQARADKVEEWLNAVTVRLEKQSGRQTFRNLTECQVVYGLGVLWDEYTPDAWDEYDQAVVGEPEPPKTGPGSRKGKAERDRTLDLVKRRQPLPWHETDLDPRSVMEFADWQGTKEVLIGIKRLRSELAEHYNLAIGEDGKLRPGALEEGPPQQSTSSLSGSASGYVEWWCYQSRWWTAYYADGVLLGEPTRNDYGKPTVFFAPGLTTSSNDPLHRYLSIAEPIKDMVKALDEMLTASHNVAMIGAFPMGHVEEPADSQLGIEEPEIDGETGEPKESPALEFAPGEFRRTAPGVKLSWVVPPEVSQTLKYIAGLYIQIIQETGSLPPITKGFAQGSDQPGYAINQLNQAALSLFAPLPQNSARAYEQAAEYKLWGVDTPPEQGGIGEVVYAPGRDPADRDRERRTYVGLGPKDVQGHYDVTFAIKAEHPLRDIAMQNAGLNAWGKGAIDWESMLSDYFNYPNAQKIIRKREREDFKKAPPIQNAIIEMVMRRLSMKGLLRPEPAAAPPGTPPADAAGGPGLSPAEQGMPPPMPATAGAQGGSVGGVMTLPNTTMAPGGLPSV